VHGSLRVDGGDRGAEAGVGDPVLADHEIARQGVREGALAHRLAVREVEALERRGVAARDQDEELGEGRDGERGGAARELDVPVGVVGSVEPGGADPLSRPVHELAHARRPRRPGRLDRRGGLALVDDDRGAVLGDDGAPVEDEGRDAAHVLPLGGAEERELPRCGALGAEGGPVPVGVEGDEALRPPVGDEESAAPVDAELAREDDLGDRVVARDLPLGGARDARAAGAASVAAASRPGRGRLDAAPRPLVELAERPRVAEDAGGLGCRHAAENILQENRARAPSVA
jgi:hypothetical protein